MIKIYKPTKDYYSCQICGCHSSVSKHYEIYTIELMNRYGQGIGLHLCKACCEDLQSLLEFTQSKDVKAVSIDEIDK